MLHWARRHSGSRLAEGEREAILVYMFNLSAYALLHLKMVGAKIGSLVSWPVQNSSAAFRALMSLLSSVLVLLLVLLCTGGLKYEFSFSLVFIMGALSWVFLLLCWYILTTYDFRLIKLIMMNLMIVSHPGSTLEALVR
jgi:uncharacterized membrane protein